MQQDKYFVISVRDIFILKWAALSCLLQWKSVLLWVLKNFNSLVSILCFLHSITLSGGFWARPAQSKVVKVKSFDFSYWAWSTPWGHVLSLKTFCQNLVLSWAIRYSVFQPVKFSSSLEFMCGNPFSTFCHLMVNFG
jgi:hypothetical protein